MQRDATTGQYSITGTGTLRLWLKDGPGTRDAQTVLLGGDYITPRSYCEASRFQYNAAAHTIMVWVEAVRPTQQAEDQTIKVELYTVDNGQMSGEIADDSVRVTAVPWLLAVDKNQDEKASDDWADRTSDSNPYRFWLNDDVDRRVTNPDDNNAPDQVDLFSGAIDSSTGKINSERDLEDFSPLLITSPFGFDPTKGWDVSLSIAATADAPSVSFFWISDQRVSKYLSDQAVATQLVQSGYNNSLDTLSAGNSWSLPSAYANYLRDEGHLNLLFEAVTAGQGALTVTFRHNGQVVTTDDIYVDLRPITAFYEQWTVGDNGEGNTAEWGDLQTRPIPTTFSPVAGSGSVEDRASYTGQYILYVHGWRMKPEERINYADTAFKRLFWEGYTGRVGLFSWPTKWMDNTGIDWYNPSDDVRALELAANFRDSEQIAFSSAASLRNLLLSIGNDNRYGVANLSLFAHSMGNTVASEALRQQAVAEPTTKLVNSYVASQAAVAGEAYSATAPLTLLSPVMPQTYDLYLYGANTSATTASPYFGNINLAANSLYNFYNSSPDYATGFAWAWQQRLKSESGSYRYDGYDAFLRTVDPGGDFIRLSDNYHLNLALQADRYEAFAYAVEGQSAALGTQAVGGVFATTPSSEVDLSKLNPLQTSPENFTAAQWDHSAEFNGTLMVRGVYWHRLLTAFGILSSEGGQ